ncbi:MAG: tetratricopeptide repeat protein [Anaerolineae bacterium]
MPDLTLTSQLAYGQALIDSGDVPGAVDLCRRILSAFPRCVQPYDLLGQAMLRRGSPERAESLFARVLSVDPQSTRAFLGMSIAHELRGAHETAQAWARCEAEVAPNRDPFAPEWLWQAVSNSSRGSDRGPTRTGLAYMMFRAGMFRQAASEFGAVLAECPSRADLAVALAEASYRFGDSSVAARTCEDLLQNLPDCLEALLILGKLELSADAEGRARERLRRAQTLDPENHLAQRLFGGDSPLPPRSVRIPTVTVAEPLALPYLLDGEELDEGDDDEPLPGLLEILD